MKPYVIPKHLPLHTDKTKDHTFDTVSPKLHLSYVPKPDTDITPFPLYPSIQMLRDFKFGGICSYFALYKYFIWRVMLSYNKYLRKL